MKTLVIALALVVSTAAHAIDPDVVRGVWSINYENNSAFVRCNRMAIGNAIGTSPVIGAPQFTGHHYDLRDVGKCEVFFKGSASVGPDEVVGPFPLADGTISIDPERGVIEGRLFLDPTDPTQTVADFVGSISLSGQLIQGMFTDVTLFESAPFTLIKRKGAN